jgi:hypothetical protein
MIHVMTNMGKVWELLIPNKQKIIIIKKQNMIKLIQTISIVLPSRRVDLSIGLMKDRFKNIKNFSTEGEIIDSTGVSIPNKSKKSL